MPCSGVSVSSWAKASRAKRRHGQRRAAQHEEFAAAEDGHPGHSDSPVGSSIVSSISSSRSGITHQAWYRCRHSSAARRECRTCPNRRSAASAGSIAARCSSSTGPTRSRARVAATRSSRSAGEDDPVDQRVDDRILDAGRVAGARRVGGNRNSSSRAARCPARSTGGNPPSPASKSKF